MLNFDTKVSCQAPEKDIKNEKTCVQGLCNDLSICGASNNINMLSGLFVHNSFHFAHKTELFHKVEKIQQNFCAQGEANCS